MLEGRRKPSGAARVLLEVAERHPEAKLQAAAISPAGPVADTLIFETAEIRGLPTGT